MKRWKLQKSYDKARIPYGTEVDKMNEEEIEIVMNALAGYPTVTTSEFADKVEKILRNYKESEDNE